MCCFGQRYENTLKQRTSAFSEEKSKKLKPEVSGRKEERKKQVSLKFQDALWCLIVLHLGSKI